MQSTLPLLLITYVTFLLKYMTYKLHLNWSSKTKEQFKTEIFINNLNLCWSFNKRVDWTCTRPMTKDDLSDVYLH